MRQFVNGAAAGVIAVSRRRRRMVGQGVVDETARTLVSLFRDTVAKHATRVAVMSGEEVMTYQELDRRAEALALVLRAGGVGRGDLVGVWVPRSTAMYVVILGVLKAGAAYVPCDEDAPAERVSAVMADSGAAVLVTTLGLALAEDVTLPPCVLLSPRLDGELIDDLGGNGRLATLLPTGRFEMQTSVRADDVAYVIYTSGSTGKPKGVVVTHANVLAFVDAESCLFDVTAEDRVWQGFSVSFDASIEELWLAWRTGAALVCVSKEILRSGPDLPPVITAARVTVLSCVPTLLAMFEGDLPTVRVLILGGEVCPPDVPRRWCTPTRRVFNTYGPTETTVVATVAELKVGRPVRIGTALPGYRTWVVDADVQPVADGTGGELVVGGPAVAQGYLGRPGLTSEMFIRPTWGVGARAYRTGDLVRVDADGQLEYLGRVDDQVKVRGHRIELAEVDAALRELPGVAAVASAVRRNGAIDVLVGYVRLRQGSPFDERDARKQLARIVPAAMVPGRFVVVSEFPRLASGKLDRKGLPDPFERDAREDVDPRPTDLDEWTEIERGLRCEFGTVLPGVDFTRSTDFFLSGGDSLAATELVSRLRGSERFRRLSVRDLYESPTIERLAQRLETLASQRNDASIGAYHSTRDAGRDDLIKGDERDIAPVAARRYRLAGLVQSIALYPLLAIMSPPWLITFIAFYGIQQRASQHRVTVAALFGVLVVFSSAPMRMALSVATKWLVLGRVRPGRYRLWGTFHLRFWFVNRVQDMMGFDHLRGTPLMNKYLRLMGANVSSSAYVASSKIRVHDLMTVGSNATIDQDAVLLGYQICDGWLHIGAISVADCARVGVRAVMEFDTMIGTGGELDDGSLLPSGTAVPDGEQWSGSPAIRTVERSDSWPSSLAVRTGGSTFGYAVGFVLLSLIPVLAALPEAILYGYIDSRFCDFTHGYWDVWKLAAAAPFAATSFVTLLSLLIVLAKRVALPVIEPGLHPLRSNWHVRKWFTDSLLHLSLDMLFPMYASLYLPPWLRLMGARVGRNVELSTASNLNPDLIDLDDGVFVADNVSLGASRVHRGWVRLDRVQIGRNSFVGNSAVVPAGTVIGNDVLIGVQSMPPTERCASERTDSSWIGIPAIELPARSSSDHSQRHLTYRPGSRRKALRAVIEFWRIIAPVTIVTVASLLLLLVAEDLADPSRLGLIATVLVFPGLLGGMGLILVMVTIAAKWILVGRYRPQEHQLWDHFVWRNEFVNTLHENVAMTVLVRLFLGTPLLPLYLRALGARIGRRTCLESSYLTEFDLVDLGDEVALNEESDLQTHLFEDRVMKMSDVRIQARASIGACSIVLYDAVVESAARLDAQSLVMKGERIPEGTRWHGSPAQPVPWAGDVKSPQTQDPAKLGHEV